MGISEFFVGYVVLFAAAGALAFRKDLRALDLKTVSDPWHTPYRIVSETPCVQNFRDVDKNLSKRNGIRNTAARRRVLVGCNQSHPSRKTPGAKPRKFIWSWRDTMPPRWFAAKPATWPAAG